MLSRLWHFISEKRPAEEIPTPPAKRQALRSAPSSSRVGKKDFKLVLLGDGAVGKTAFVKRHLTGEFLKVYKPTEGCEMSKLRVTTTAGDIVFQVWDTAGREQFGGLRDGYFIGADCALVFFDVTKRDSLLSVQTWLQDLRKVTGDIPTIVIGNKVDCQDRIVKAQEGSVIMRKHKVQYYDLSVKSRFNLEAPLLWLAKRLLGEPSLTLCGEAAKAPSAGPPAQLSEQQRRQAERDLALACSVAVGDDSDEDL
eukprot:CAMPEP_0197661984 /NCGR_PEP_ID=MMETSP1338-20131121/51788_1 /TAXON_ID=43686 ORGANISM="Pelagodinium beii, Strain RCC1491" /NCGR_SAMPLE_ID=MMETSP1338 /ASSEMBLY_ACC=CAM_ASM_000754 /LENGTH=252 /DNA_ID=CAMNT_0043239647 /DNA_START=29 /DNA_END=787 /DNA_ORIENTATION=-